MTTDWKALCTELLRIADDYHPDRNEDCPLALTQMREAVSELAERLSAQSEPKGPTDKALASFTAYFCRNYPGPDTIIHKPEWHAPKIFHAAADALARWGRPAIKPVPVSERLPGPEDCWPDGHEKAGCCWLWTSEDGLGRWEVRHRDWASEPDSEYTHWRPYYAMPTPQP